GSGSSICNACGLYFKLHGVDRPLQYRRITYRPENASQTPPQSQKRKTAIEIK
ncbi:Putative LOC100651088, partial [Caligus rogercresseyi]